VSDVLEQDDSSTCKTGDAGVENSQQTVGEQIEAAGGASCSLSRNYHQFRSGESLVLWDFFEEGRICVPRL